MEQRERRFFLLLEGNEQLAEAIQPRTGAFDDPATGGMVLGSCGRFELLFTDAAHVRGVPTGDDLLFGAASVIAFVHAQVRADGRGIGPRNRRIVQGAFHQMLVMDIGTGYQQPCWDTGSIRQQAALAPLLPTIRRIRPRRRPAKGAFIIETSRLCQSTSRPTRSVFTATVFAQTWPKTLARCHRRK